MIVSGFGFRSNATVDSFRSAFENTRSKHKFSKPLVVAVPQDKVNHNSLIFFARGIGCKILAINPSDIESMQTVTNSAMSERFRNTGSVSEACALVAAGSEAELIVFREISADRRATCSIAKAKF